MRRRIDSVHRSTYVEEWGEYEIFFFFFLGSSFYTLTSYMTTRDMYLVFGNTDMIC